MTAPDAPVPLWRLRVRVPAAAVAATEAALEGVSVAVSSFGDDDGRPWCVEGYVDRPPDEAAIGAGLAIAAEAAGIAVPPLEVDFLTPRDWLAENRERFPPLRIGRFFIHPSHHDGPPPAAAIAFEIDAGTAFGSGTHPTTATCLAVLQDLAARARPGRVLDLGCGSAILAMAAARLWPAEVLAVDIDPEAVRVSRRNVKLNGLADRVRIAESVGYRSADVRRAGPFDLIVANVLARPLVAMAGATARALAPGGHAVLSGLVERDAAWVAAHHRGRGLILARRLIRDGWATLVMRKPQRRT